MTEHDPIFTVGVRRDALQNLRWNETELRERGLVVQATNRGGDITHHGPGQIVGYPIVNLAARHDLHAYLRFLEGVMISSLASFGLAAGRRAGLTGLWVGSRKIAALGVALRLWTTFHGFALNVNVDLAPFAGIVTCGIPADQGTVTSLQFELGRPVESAAVATVIAAEFWRALPGFIAGSG